MTAFVYGPFVRLIFRIRLNLSVHVPGDMFLVVYSVVRRETWNEAKDIITAIDETVGNPIGTYTSMARNFKKVRIDKSRKIPNSSFE